MRVFPLPKWIMSNYSILWGKFKDKEFSHEQATSVVKQKRMTSIMLSQMKKNGWVSVRLNEKDSRKRHYKLSSPEEAVKGMGNE